MLGVRGEREVIVPIVDLPLPGLCTAQRIFGIDCPGCGLTRSFISLAHGDLARACHFNAVGVLFFLFVAAQIPYQLWQLWRIQHGRPAIVLGAWGVAPIVIIGGMLVIQWVIKISGQSL